MHQRTADPADEDLRDEPLAVAGGAPERMTDAPDGLLGHPPIVDLLVGPVPKPIRNDPQVLLERWRQRYNTIRPSQIAVNA